MKNALCAALLFPAVFLAGVAFAAGGPADIVGRLYAHHLSASLGS